MQEPTTAPPQAGNPANFPENWLGSSSYDPNAHLMSLKGKDYLSVQERMVWFIRDQRALIASGLARMPYVVRTELVEMDREQGWAHFRTYVRDVLGNESTMYGSEAAKDFGDYAEKAGTKSLGRALLALGYGTAMASEFDDHDSPADTPLARRGQQQHSQQQQQRAATAQSTTTWEPSADDRFCARVRALGITTKGQLDAFLAESEGMQEGTTPKQRAYLLLAQKERQAAQADAHDLSTLATGGGRS